MKKMPPTMWPFIEIIRLFGIVIVTNESGVHTKLTVAKSNR